MLVPFHCKTKMTTPDPSLVKPRAAFETVILRLQTSASVSLPTQWHWGEERNEARSMTPNFLNYHPHPGPIFKKRALIND